MPNLNESLRFLEAIEANLVKLEKLYSEIEQLIPEGSDFPDGSEYEEKCRGFRRVLTEIPKVDGFSIEDHLFPYPELVGMRVDVLESGTFEAGLYFAEQIGVQGENLREYRSRLEYTRRALIREEVLSIADAIDQLLERMSKKIDLKNPTSLVRGRNWDKLCSLVSQLETLFGSGKKFPAGWDDLIRHVHFGEMHDLRDIVEVDWPQVRSSLNDVLYVENDPIPVEIDDISSLTKSTTSPSTVVTALKWDKLSPEAFERLIYSLIVSTEGYENPEWLTATNAPDRGRDLSAYRVTEDPLSGAERRRVFIQCRHVRSRGISVSDISDVLAKKQLSEPPRVDVVIFATSGRFTSDAVAFVEKHNQSDSPTRIEMWPDSRLEHLLARRPDLIADFRLR